jgi:hypothetical protein
MESAQLKGLSGATYEFAVLDLDQDCPDQPGNFAFARRNDFGHWALMYVGDTDNLRRHASHHPFLDAARRSGCTHLLTHSHEDGSMARRMETHDLVELFQPALNRL